MRWKLAVRVLVGTATTTIRAAELGATTTAVIIPGGSGDKGSVLDDLRREVRAADVRLALLPRDESGRIEGLRRDLEAWRDAACARLESHLMLRPG
jgi:hypothetical protein